MRDCRSFSNQSSSDLGPLPGRSNLAVASEQTPKPAVTKSDTTSSLTDDNAVASGKSFVFQVSILSVYLLGNFQIIVSVILCYIV